MSTPSKKPIGMVKQRTLGSRCSKMLSVSAKDADWLTILWAKAHDLVQQDDERKDANPQNEAREHFHARRSGRGSAGMFKTSRKSAWNSSFDKVA